MTTETGTEATSVNPPLDDSQGLHPDLQGVLQHFAYVHLPPYLQQTSKRFSELAWWTAFHLSYDQNSYDPQVLACLLDLLRSKDCAVRAARVTHLKEKGLDVNG